MNNENFLAFFSKFKHLTFKGRMKRKPFLIHTVVNLIIFFSLFFAGGGLISLLKPESSEWFLWSFAILVIIYGISEASAIVRRLHDFDAHGINILWASIPIVNIVFFIELFFRKGTDGENKYGK